MLNSLIKIQLFIFQLPKKDEQLCQLRSLIRLKNTIH